jgi:acyl-CoA thioester hydrolase
MAAMLFPVSLSLPVQWGEMDSYGHVNNAVYLRYFEGARIAYFRALALPGWVDKDATSPHGGPILHSTRARYRIPLTFPDTVTVGTSVTRIDADRFTMALSVWSERHQAVAAEGEAIIVVYDYANARKMKIDATLRAAIERIEGKSPPPSESFSPGGS